jgi:hypothetical protein
MIDNSPKNYVSGEWYERLPFNSWQMGIGCELFFKGKIGLALEWPGGVFVELTT